MADNLVIVESPAKAKTIGRYLGKNYKIVASVGHIRDLPKSQIGVDVEKDFEPKYITIRGKGDVISGLKKDAKNSKRVFLATDPDREGEAISWHLATILNIENDAKCRVSFNEITKNAVASAIKAPRKLDMDLVDAQQARRILDRLVGYKISPLLWRKVRKGLSAGRVQSVSTRLICDRESEIEAFVSEEYWSVQVKLAKQKQRAAFLAKFYGDENGKKRELKTKEETDALLEAVKGGAYRVRSVKESEKRKFPAPPFITSTLQQEASRRLNFQARRTMSVVQQLYEGVNIAGLGLTGLVTYIRTDSTRISQEALTESARYITEKYGAAYLPKSPRVFANRNAAQDAHEAIRPSHFDLDPERVRASLTNEQFRLYKLIWDRFIACQMEAAVYDQMSVDIISNAKLFRAVGSKIKFKGFTAVYEEAADDDGSEKEGDGDGESRLPELAEGEELDFREILPNQHFTQPPPRYTEATLIRALEEKGIGRPSTYAPTITTILARGYVEKEKKAIFPTELGKAVNQIMTQHFADIVDVAFTADMEKKLDDVEEGQKAWRALLHEFYDGFEKVLKTAEEGIGDVELPDEVTDVLCEKCGRNMVIKMGRYGKFLACPGYPACRNAKPIVEYAGVNCPKCGAQIVYRKTKKGKKYIACENSSACDYRSWDLPTKDVCPICGKFMQKSSWGGKNARAHCCDELCPNGIPKKPETAKAPGTTEDPKTAGEAIPAEGKASSAGRASSGGKAPTTGKKRKK
ncbi:MAG: type I DNA topoisomerase [Clostridiales bacterium]|nr:type I DNA topoisomerase [Clostridiales bacterium]